MAAKFIIVIVAVIGAASLFSSGHAAAANICPSISRVGSGIPAGFGYNKGEAVDGFGGLVVASSVGTMTNGQPDDKGRTGNPIDAKYNLNSYLPDAPSGYEYRLNGHPQHDRIFTVDSSNNTTNRDHQRWFGTNGSTGDSIYAGNGSGYTCPGWDILGPGMAGEIGNRHALDCGESYYLPNNPSVQGRTPSRFWISDLPSPNGESGQWEVQVYGMNATYSFNFSPGSMGPGDAQKYLTIKNGATVRINLVWHADPPPPPDVTSECNTLYVRDGGTWTRPSDGKVFSSDDVRTKVRVEDSGGHALVHPANDNPSAYFYLNNEDRTWTYTPLAKDVHVIVIREYKSSSGVWNFAEDNSRWHYNCYHTGNPGGAACSISATGNVAGKPQGVKAGSQISVSVSVNNTGMLNLPDQLAGHEFWFDSDGGQTGGLQSVNIRLPTIGVGRSFNTTVVINAPSTIGHYHFSGSPVYRGLFYPGDASCGYDIDVYQYFTAGLGASASLSPTKEDPSSVNYNTNVSVNPSSPQVYIPTTSLLYKLPAGGGQQNLASSGGGIYPGSWSGSFPIGAGTFNAGDQFCTKIDASYLSGWIGPNGPYDVAETGFGGSSDPPPHCDKVINEPYATFLGSDVSGGGGFGAGQTCVQTSKGGIYTYNEGPNGPASGAKAGTSAQFGAQAMDVIQGLGSAGLRTSSPTGLSGLSFANNTGIGGSGAKQVTGGNLGNPSALSNFCVPDYFSDMSPATAQTPDTSTTDITAGTGSGQLYYKPASGTLRINGGTIPNGTNQAIFVDGNVEITNNIAYSSAARSSVKDIPSFFLIVKNGNIHIDEGVGQIDGAYIAEPSVNADGTVNAQTPKTGIINTCWVMNDTNSIYNRCKKQLVVNGAFVAKQVLLARSYSSLRYSKSGENNLDGGPARSCGNIGTDVPAGAGSAQVCAAEIFNFSPELYMSQPALNSHFGAASGKYDAITSLSPVL